MRPRGSREKLNSPELTKTLDECSVPRVKMPAMEKTNKRSSNLGMIPGIANRFAKELSLNIFHKTCINRFFELETARVYNTGAIRCPIYLSLGQEQIPAAISAISKKFLLFAQHRAHSYYLSFGGGARRLIDELLNRKSGCAGGMGGSASIHDPAIGMFGHSGLMGDQVPIAVGAALGSGKRVLTVMGDASAEEDYVLGALGYAATKRVPVLFLCEDNNLSILTEVKTRRSWDLTTVADTFGLPSFDITDDPWLVAHHVSLLIDRLPAFLNIRTCRVRWHAGTGTDGPPEWDRFELMKRTMAEMGLGNEAREIENRSEQEMRALWAEQLAKPSA